MTIRCWTTGVHQAYNNDITALLYFQQVNIAFESVQLVDLNASDFAHILQFNQSNITISSLYSSGCSVQDHILQLNKCGGADDQQAVQITNANFQGGQYGGIWIRHSNAEVYQSTFDSLTGIVGGGILVDNEDGSSITISDCTFSNNIAAQTNATQYEGAAEGQPYGGYGGALALEALQINISRSSFVNNTCDWNGGAIVISSLAHTDPAWGNDILTIWNNSAPFDNEVAYIDSCTFSGNDCGLRGAPLYMFGSLGKSVEELRVLNSTFVGSSVNDAHGVNLWGVRLAYFEGCTFTNGSYMYAYGYRERWTSLFLVNSVFAENSGAYNLNDASSDVKGDVNDAGECGGVLCSFCECIGVYNTTFMNNIGAGLCIENSMGACEINSSASPWRGYVYPPLFNRSTVTGEADPEYIIDFLHSFSGDDILTTASADIRYSTFANNIAPGVLRAAADESLSEAAVQSGGAMNMVDAYTSIIAHNIFTNNSGTALLLTIHVALHIETHGAA